jgi:DNA anti-recombination protein RmuC
MSELTFSTLMALLQPIDELWNMEKALQQAIAIAERTG